MKFVDLQHNHILIIWNAITYVS